MRFYLLTRYGQLGLEEFNNIHAVRWFLLKTAFVTAEKGSLKNESYKFPKIPIFIAIADRVQKCYEDYIIETPENGLV